MLPSLAVTNLGIPILSETNQMGQISIWPCLGEPTDGNVYKRSNLLFQNRNHHLNQQLVKLFNSKAWGKEESVWPYGLREKRQLFMTNWLDRAIAFFYWWTFPVGCSSNCRSSSWLCKNLWDTLKTFPAWCWRPLVIDSCYCSYCNMYVFGMLLPEKNWSKTKQKYVSE